MFGRKKRKIAEQQKQIEALLAEKDRLAAENQAYQERASDVERRESGIGRAISEATMAADKMLEDAQRKAGALLEQTQADCDAVRRDAEIMVDDAYRNARDIVKEAEVTGQKKLDEMNHRITQYATLLNAYDKLVQEQIQMAQDSARRFAELSQALHDTIPEILTADGTLAIREAEESEEEQEPAAEQDVGFSPEDEPELSYPVSEQENLMETEPDETGGEDEEPVEDSGEGTPLIRDEFTDFEDRPFSLDRKTDRDPTEEHLWTVDEIANEDAARDSHVDAIIDDILRASIEQNRE